MYRVPRALGELSYLIRVTQESFYYYPILLTWKYIGKMKPLSQSADLESSTPTLSVCICRSSQQLWGHLLIFSTVKGSIYTLLNENLQIKVFFEAGLPPALKSYGSVIRSLPWILAPMPTALHITGAAEVVFFHMFSLKWGDVWQLWNPTELPQDPIC